MALTSFLHREEKVKGKVVSVDGHLLNPSRPNVDFFGNSPQVITVRTRGGDAIVVSYELVPFLGKNALLTYKVYHTGDSYP